MVSKNKRKRSGKPLEALHLIGMVHLPPLPGSANAAMSIDDIGRLAVSEARLLEKAGFDAVIVENFGDAPFAATDAPKETLAAMSIVVRDVVGAVGVPVGVNLLRNDAFGALAVAAATGALFIRVNVLSGVYATDQGIITGNAAELLARRRLVAPHVQIAADVHVKHAAPLSQHDIALAAEETAYRAGADALIVSGSGTGVPTDLSNAERVKRAVPDRPLWIGSGATAETICDTLKVADGAIVGTALKRGGRTTNPIDPTKMSKFMKAARTG
ncbi:MAG: BtpA/SgcQ family protein [Phycisphaerales bacterium]|nr:BtpA/SgcQ family protein [Phycisphaerales bacterium]MCB9857520.1 BtpA/SgcQ family protein [Phycisphaerales bacterium]MCB9864495.1 BtpA/SgcQ family protein [Phycisphaerales bacterium]